MMKKIFSVILIIFLVGIFVVAVLFCGAAVSGTIVGLWDIPDKLNWKAKTHPLTPEVTMDLCRAFNLPAKDPKCVPGNDVYGPDFYGVIRKEFQPEDMPWATYEDVQNKIGKYQIRFEEPITTGDGFTYFVAVYDLQGDQVYRIAIFFHADGRIWRLVADIGD